MKIHKSNPDIRIGSVIASYHDGYHRVIRLFTEEVYGITLNMVEYVRLCDFDGIVSNVDTNTCNVRYCSLLNPSIVYDDDVTQAGIKKNRLLGVMNDS